MPASAYKTNVHIIIHNNITLIIHSCSRPTVNNDTNYFMALRQRTKTAE